MLYDLAAVAESLQEDTGYQQESWMSSSLEKHHIGKEAVQILPSPKTGKIFHPLSV